MSTSGHNAASPLDLKLSLKSVEVVHAESLYKEALSGCLCYDCNSNYSDYDYNFEGTFHFLFSVGASEKFKVQQRQKPDAALVVAESLLLHHTMWKMLSFCPYN